uniref:Cytohesin 1 interacting protein n=1 Tax=Tetraodon nigroviridis TaxID=99883 RepID=H3DGE2_TETNG
MRVRHRCHVMWISASTLSSFGCAAGPDHTPSEAAGNGSALRRLSEAAAMNLNALRGQPSQESFVLDGALRRKCSLWYRRSLRGSGERTRRDMGSLTRGHKLDQPRSLVDYCDPQRITVVMEKQDNQTFGFEIQTYGLQLKDSSEVEMCTSISKVHEDSAAESAGLTAGDIIITINGASIEGLSHQNILDLVRKSDNSLMMETVCGSKVKQIELEKRMSVLKQTLREKLVELQALIVEEKRLTQAAAAPTSRRTPPRR